MRNLRTPGPALVVTVEEAAMMLHISRVTAYDLVRKKLLKSIKIGNCRRVLVSSVHDFIERLTPDDDAA